MKSPLDILIGTNISACNKKIKESNNDQDFVLSQDQRIKSECIKYIAKELAEKKISAAGKEEVYENPSNLQ